MHTNLDIGCIQPLQTLLGGRPLRTRPGGSRPTLPTLGRVQSELEDLSLVGLGIERDALLRRLM